jgi:hypothetical protein
MPKCYGWGSKAQVNFVPYYSDSSAIGDNNYFAKEYEEGVYERALQGFNISKYFKQSNVIAWESESEEEKSKSSAPIDSEKEIKLRNSDEYEIHTITEESEQVTQTDIKALTPSSFSSKPITPNKRYLSQDVSGSQNDKHSFTKNLMMSDEIKNEIKPTVPKVYLAIRIWEKLMWHKIHQLDDNLLAIKVLLEHFMYFNRKFPLICIIIFLDQLQK